MSSIEDDPHYHCFKCLLAHLHRINRSKARKRTAVRRPPHHRDYIPYGYTLR